jgi:hypothetical protein
VTEANTAAAFAAYTRALQAPALIAAAQEKVRQTAERRAVEEDRLASLYGQLNHITGWNLATWLPRVTGRIRDRQSKVADAILQQHVRRDNAAAEHETALGTMLSIQAAIDGLPLAREAAVAAMTGAGAGQAQQQVTVAKELSGALAAVGRAQAIVTSMTGELTSAQLWSGHDTYLGGGIMSSALKQDRIYEANDLGAALTQELTTLRKNLQDLNVPTSYFSVQNNDVIASTDVTFDNIFSDFVMSTRINNAQDRLERLKLGLVEVSAKLGNEHKAIVEQLDQLLATEMNARPPQPSA